MYPEENRILCTVILVIFVLFIVLLLFSGPCSNGLFIGEVMVSLFSIFIILIYYLFSNTFNQFLLLSGIYFMLLYIFFIFFPLPSVCYLFTWYVVISILFSGINKWRN